MKKLHTLFNNTAQAFSRLISLASVYIILLQEVWAHHTKDHMMLQTDPQQVIEGTQQGMVFSWSWIIWFFVFFLIFTGILRQWKK